MKSWRHSEEVRVGLIACSSLSAYAIFVGRQRRRGLTIGLVEVEGVAAEQSELATCFKRARGHMSYVKVTSAIRADARAIWFV